MGAAVTLVLEDPDGAEVHDDSVDIDETGEFIFAFPLDDDADTGIYTVILSYEQLDDKVLTFTVFT